MVKESLICNYKSEISLDCWRRLCDYTRGFLNSKRILISNSLHTSAKLGGFNNDDGDGNENNVKKQKV